MSSSSQSNRTFAVQSSHALVLCGREEILPHAALLEQVAENFGQLGAMNWLEYFLSGTAIRIKQPRLVLLLTPGAAADRLERDSICGCALFFEYVWLGRNLNTVVTDDAFGFRTVLAPSVYRAQVAERCASELLDRGAQIVLVTYAGEPVEGDAVPLTKVPGKWACRTRRVGSHLELLPSFAATLARFTKKVRYPLRYYRRRLLTTTPCTFVPDATAELTEEAFLSMNRSCLNVITDEEAALRWRACRLRGGMR